MNNLVAIIALIVLGAFVYYAVSESFKESDESSGGGGGGNIEDGPQKPNTPPDK